MKKLLSFFLIGLMLCFAFTGCSDKPKLDPDNPVTLTMWHVYGEQADSPMNRLIEEFNHTVGAEKGIIINVTLILSLIHICVSSLQQASGIRSFCRTCRRSVCRRTGRAIPRDWPAAQQVQDSAQEQDCRN